MDYVITSTSESISAGDGDNNISITSASGGNNTVITGAGNDSIQVEDRDETEEQRYYNRLDAGEGNNYINNGTVELSTIRAGSGNDTIITGGGEAYNRGYSSEMDTSIVAGAGDNQISVNSNMTYGRIYASGGSDLVSILGDGGNNIISVGDGRNTIITNNHYDYTYNAQNTIEAGNGSDLIYTIAQNSFINAGSGRNYISLGSSAGNTIVTGKGDDTITFGTSSGNNVIIFGEGKDIVYNFASGDTIGVAGSLTQNTVGSDVILTDGTSNMTLKGAAGKDISIATLSSDNNVYKILAADNTVGDTVLPGGLSDTTPPDTTPPDTTPPDTTPASKFITLTENADDYDNTVEGVTIAALGGDDTITNSVANVSISGGTGDDSFVNSGENVTFKYNAGDGNDVITGFNADDTLSIAGASYSSATSGNDIIITVDDGSITLKDAASLTTINIDGTLKSDGSIPADALEYNGHKYYLYSDEGLAWEEARIYCEERGGHLVTITDADEQAVVQNLVKEKGTKNSYWMGGFKDKVTKNSKWITDEEFNYANWGWNQPDGDGNALMMYRSTKNGWPLGTWNDLNADGTCGTQKFFGLQNMGFICEWEETPVNIIEPTLSAETLVLDNNTTTPAIFGEDTEVADATRRKKPVSIVGNDLANSIVGGKGNDTLDGAGDDDTLTGGKGNDLFIYNGGDDLITDYNSKDKISVASANLDFEINSTDLIFDFGNNDSLTIADGASIAVNINSTVNYYTEDGVMDGKQKLSKSGVRPRPLGLGI